MFSRADSFRVRRCTTIARVASHCGALALAGISMSAVLAYAADGYIVPADDAPRFAGPVGDEANIAEILATREQTDGVLGMWRYEAAPEFGPPLHIHAEEDEAFYVLDGEFAIQLGDCVTVASAGSFVFVPKDTEHTFRNMSKEAGRLLGVVTPGGFEGFFQAA